MTYRKHNSSTLQDQPTDPSSKPIPKSSSSSASTSSSFPTTSSDGTSSGSKRKRHETGDNDKQQQKRRRFAQDKPTSTSAARLACFYNKHDPMMYRSNAQTHKKFEICETHDFQNMNKLFEHLKRVHSGQSVQCPRCASTDFETPEELLAHQAASEACVWAPLTQVKRIKWISDDQRLALQSEVAKELRGRSDANKWTFAYERLFPDVSPDNIPSPFLQDPVISIVSFVTDHYETCLRDEIRHSSDLSDLEGRISTILEDFLAQYGITTNGRTQIPNLTSSMSTVQSSPEIELGPLPTLESSDALENDNWLRDEHFVLPTVEAFGEWASGYDTSNEISIEDDMLDFTSLDADPLEKTSALHFHDLPPGVQ